MVTDLPGGDDREQNTGGEGFVLDTGAGVPVGRQQLPQAQYTLSRGAARLHRPREVPALGLGPRPPRAHTSPLAHRPPSDLTLRFQTALPLFHLQGTSGWSQLITLPVMIR